MVRRDTDYAMRALVYLAEHQEDNAITVKTIAENSAIPLDYAYKIMRKLGETGITESRLGSQGGFVLKRSPSDITLLDVIEAIQGPVSVSNCVSDPDFCPRHITCKVSPKWAKIQQSMISLLQSTTLASIITDEEV